MGGGDEPPFGACCGSASAVEAVDPDGTPLQRPPREAIATPALRPCFLGDNPARDRPQADDFCAAAESYSLTTETSHPRKRRASARGTCDFDDRPGPGAGGC